MAPKCGAALMMLGLLVVPASGVAAAPRSADVPPPVLVPQTVDFGEIQVGDTVAREVRLENRSDSETLEITTVIVEPPFERAGGSCEQLVGPSSSCTVRIEVTPDAPGDLVGVLEIIDRKSVV